MGPGQAKLLADMPYQDLYKWCRNWFGAPTVKSGRCGKANGYSRLDALSLTLGRRLLDHGLQGPRIKMAVKSFRKLMETGRYANTCLKISSDSVEIAEPGAICLNLPDAVTTMNLEAFVNAEIRKPDYLTGHVGGWELRRRREAAREART